MKRKSDQRGALLIEAAVVLPIIMILMLLFVYLINLFTVYSLVQYSLNQTVNELGNYTYYLSYLGIIDWSRDTNKKLNEETKELRVDVDMVVNAYSSIETMIGSGQDTLGDIQELANGNFNMDQLKQCASGIMNVKNQTDTVGKNVSSVWEMVKGFANNPASLLSLLKSQLFSEMKDTIHNVMGAIIGKAMFSKYVDNAVLEGCGVVSTDYDGSNVYTPGIAGMDFSRSSFLGDDDSRVIDIVVYYRIRFPFNFSKFIPSLDSDSIIGRNSMLITQRAVGYGWIDGDGKGNAEYNGEKRKTFLTP